MKKKKRNNDSAAVNSKLIRKPIERCFLIFLAPTLAAFTIGFVYPFLKGFYLSFCNLARTNRAKQASHTVHNLPLPLLKLKYATVPSQNRSI